MKWDGLEVKASDWWDLATCDLDQLPDVEGYEMHDGAGACRVKMADGRQFMIRVEEI